MRTQPLALLLEHTAPCAPRSRAPSETRCPDLVNGSCGGAARVHSGCGHLPPFPLYELQYNEVTSKLHGDMGGACVSTAVWLPADQLRRTAP